MSLAARRSTVRFAVALHLTLIANHARKSGRETRVEAGKREAGPVAGKPHGSRRLVKSDMFAVTELWSFNVHCSEAGDRAVSSVDD